MFDPQQFLDMPMEGANDTVSVPVPVADYLAIVDKVDVRQWRKKDDPTVSGLALDLIWSIQDDTLKQFLGRDKVTCKQGIMLDLTESGGLDMGKGKNIGLGRLREAVGLNTPGQPFSFSMLLGQMGKISVKHRVDGDSIFAEVKAVAKAA